MCWLARRRGESWERGEGEGEGEGREEEKEEKGKEKGKGREREARRDEGKEEGEKERVRKGGESERQGRGEMHTHKFIVGCQKDTVYIPCRHQYIYTMTKTMKGTEVPNPRCISACDCTC